MLILIIIILLSGLIFTTLYCAGFRKPCYRIVEEIYMNVNGKLSTNYIVQQYNKFYIFDWWLIQSSGDQFSSGSIFDNMTDANNYIKSLIYNKNIRKVAHKPICADS